MDSRTVTLNSNHGSGEAKQCGEDNELERMDLETSDLMLEIPQKPLSGGLLIVMNRLLWESGSLFSMSFQAACPQTCSCGQSPGKSCQKRPYKHFNKRPSLKKRSVKF
jgi:hypothetical protein